MRMRRIKLIVSLCLLVALVAGAFVWFGPLATSRAQAHARARVGARSSGGTTSSSSCSPQAGVWSYVPSVDVLTQSHFTGVAAVSSQDVWAVGDYTNANQITQTLIEHWNGSAWSVVPSPNVGTSNNTLTGITALSSSNVWAVGYVYEPPFNVTLIEHWNGASWSVISSPNQNNGNNWLYSISGDSASDIWAVGSQDAGGQQQALIEHWNGSSWSISANPTNNLAAPLSGVTAISSSDAWAVSNLQATPYPLIDHWDGAHWTVVSAGAATNSFLSAVTAISATNIWAVGAQDNWAHPLIEHWNGASWSVVPSPTPASSNIPRLTGITAISANDIWAVGSFQTTTVDNEIFFEHWNGSSWTMTPTPPFFFANSAATSVAIASTGADTWAVGASGSTSGDEGTLALHYKHIYTGLPCYSHT